MSVTSWTSMEIPLPRPTETIQTVLWVKIFHSAPIFRMPCRGFRPVTWPWEPPREKGAPITATRFTGKIPDTPLGIAVIKASIFFVEKELTPEETSIQLVVDPQGMIFISSRSEWLYQLLWQLKPDDIRHLRKPANSATVPGTGRGSGKMGENGH
jgi:hypothetical protein